VDGFKAVNDEHGHSAGGWGSYLYCKYYKIKC
jgi:predicted signal transduction protein with EAL and GGDEF domain